jgi:hypothetical protein
LVYALIYSNIPVCRSLSLAPEAWVTDCVLYIFLSFGGYGGYAGNDHEFLMYPPRILPSAGTAGTPISHHEFSLVFALWYIEMKNKAIKSGK